MTYRATTEIAKTWVTRCAARYACLNDAASGVPAHPLNADRRVGTKRGRYFDRNNGLVPFRPFGRAASRCGVCLRDRLASRVAVMGARGLPAARRRREHPGVTVPRRVSRVTLARHGARRRDRGVGGARSSA
jgi:hypothetical protein